MRFLHTADWHLGRLFHQVHLTADQDYVLRQIVGIARDARVAAVVVAGDVYDRAVPPPEAVRLLDDVLSELLLDVKVPVIVAAGNHDSPDRLAFGARVLAAQGLHLFGLPSRRTAPVVLEDPDGRVAFYVAPYAEPALVREEWPEHEVPDHEAAMRALVSSVLAAHPPSGRSVFVGHAFVQGGLVTDSERPLSVGGAGIVSASTFDAFCYAALGHLHRPQEIAAPRAGRDPDLLSFSARLRYAGAPLKYSFDEVGQDRSVSIVDIDAAGTPSVEVVPLRPLRELRRLEGTLEDLLADGQHAPDEARDDYLVARLTDPHPVLDPIGRLRKVYRNILCIERTPLQGPGEGRPAGDRRQLEHGQLFAGFFKEMTGQEPTAEQQAVFASVADGVAGREREVPA